MARKREPEPLGPEALAELIRSVLAALHSDPQATCLGCARAESCAQLGAALAKVTSPTSRAVVASGRCDRWAPRPALMAEHVQPRALETAELAE